MTKILYLKALLIYLSVPLQQNKYEDFYKFLDRFYSDTIFQQARVSRPLEGTVKYLKIITNEETIVTSDWSKENLKVLFSFESIHNQFPNSKRSLVRSGESFIERIYIDNSGFSIERTFSLIDQKWYLTKYNYNYF